MSMPEFPTISPALTREEAINQIISSIAMEELALSHIINAEGEKLQYVLGTIPGSTGPQPTIEQVLDVNESVRTVLQSAAETQSVLRSKLQAALSASTMRGPTGPQGEPGVVESVGFQATMLDGPTIVEAGENFIFNQVIYDSPDISYDLATGIFTLNQTGEYSFYTVNFWFFSDGYGEAFPYSMTLNMNGAPYSYVSVPYSETQISSTAIVPAGASTVTIAVNNSSAAGISLPDTGTQAKITILGFKS